MTVFKNNRVDPVSAKGGFKHKNTSPRQQKNKKSNPVPKTKEPESGAKRAALQGCLPG